MRSSLRKRRQPGLISSATTRTWQAFRHDPIPWLDVLRLVVGASLALIIAYSLNVSGGFVTVLGVLFIPFMPHNPILGLLRIISGLVACGLGWVLSYQFVDQPWLLVPMLAINSFIFFYLLARGLPLMSMLLLGLFPLAVGWMIMTGRTGSDVVVLVLELEAGIVAAEIVCFIWPKTAERQLRTRIGTELRAAKDDYQAMLGENDERGLLGKVQWQPARSLGFNRLSEMMRAERGPNDPVLSRLLSIVNHTRYLLAWPTIFSSFVPAGRFDRWMTDLRSTRNRIHQTVYRILPDMAAAVVDRRPASSIDDFDQALEGLHEKTSEWLESNRNTESIDTISLPLLRCDLGSSFGEHLHGIHDLTHGVEPPDPLRTHEIAPTILERVKRGFDPRSFLFAFRATLCPLTALMIGMAYPDWSGALILVLLSGFLAPLTMGGIAMMFIDRLYGLVLAALLALVFYLLIMPDLVEIGPFLLLLSLFALPFLILTVNPATMGIGLSGAMAMYFMLSSPNNPMVDLNPIQARLLSVGGATCISFLVFTFVFPVRAVDTVGSRLAEVLNQMAAVLEGYKSRLSWQEDPTEDPDPEELAHYQRLNEERVWIDTHLLVEKIMAFDQVVNDLQWELTHNEMYARLRTRVLQQINDITPVLVNLMFCKVHSDHLSNYQEMTARHEARSAIFRLILGLAHYSDSDNSDMRSLDDLLLKARAANSALKKQIEAGDFRTTLAKDHPQHAGTRALLVEYAYNGALIRHLRRVRYLLKLRRQMNLLQRGVTVNSDYPGG